MAKGKVQHWKHGWIPLDDFARRLVGKMRGDDVQRRSGTATADPDELRHARYAAHLKETADKRAAQSRRYQEHLNATAVDRAARAERYRAAQARKGR